MAVQAQPADRPVPDADGQDEDGHRVVLGQRLRQLRHLQQLSLAAVARHAGTSPSFLSQLERGATSASISSLRRICAVLGVTLAELFEEDGALPMQVLRRADRPSVETEPGTHKYLLTRKPLRNLEVYAGEFEPDTSTGDQYAHGVAQELFVVLSGTVLVELGDAASTLSAGDSIEYSTAIPHRAVNVGDERAEVLWIVSPPTEDE
jgi:transcriptional regulator with XRE-family HTH domain